MILRYTALLLLSLTCTVSTLRAQLLAHRDDDISYPAVRLNMGFGGGSLVGVFGDLSVQLHESSIMTLQAIYLEEFRICIFGCEGEAEYRGGVGLLYGAFFGGKYAYSSISGGLALSYVGTEIEDSSFIKRTTIGIPIEAQAFLTPLPIVGIGVIGTANLNPVASYFGIFVAVQLHNQF